MHYRHAYHAGNFADVFKHVVLVALLQVLSRKDKPWCFVDTHAGAGCYGLSGDAAGRTGEWVDGIGRVWSARPRAPLLATYLESIRAADAGAEAADSSALPRCYPGSPWLAQWLARPGDRVVACEQAADVASALRDAVPTAEVHCRDGYESLALLPPAERRGLVLVDPPFERADEFDAAAAFIQRAGARFGGGTYTLWYPLKNIHAADRCRRRLARDADRPVLDLRIDVGRRAIGHLHACGLAVVNPPWGFETVAGSALDELAGMLGGKVECGEVN